MEKDKNKIFEHDDLNENEKEEAKQNGFSNFN